MALDSLLQWNDHYYIGGKGILVASDLHSEWLLKWWWKSYSTHASFPITFFDLGMSRSASLWCEKRGNVIPFSLLNKEHLTFANHHKSLLKPYLFLQTPYDQNIWLDLDCKVKQPIDSLFDYVQSEDDFALVILRLASAIVYNTGVLVFKRFSSIISHWAHHIATQPNQFSEDVTALIDLLNQKALKVGSIPLCYNWPSSIDRNPNSTIIHYVSKQGKIQILKQHEYGLRQ